MGTWPRNDRGITTLEFAILVAAILAALIAGQVYLRRAISYKWRESVDGTFGQGLQYSTEPGKETTIVEN